MYKIIRDTEIATLISFARNDTGFFTSLLSFRMTIYLVAMLIFL